MTVKENSQNLGTMLSTVLKISQKYRLIFEPTIMIEFRLKNALDFYNFFKMDLIKIPWKFRL